ncbi:hypothetical protein ISP17_10960 [Dyella ginsengisoli]|uniref:Uncharacterized protein n=1 Tax=Dyella ginsengisoli TaxID=363848 RepID=A0ABW8JTK9_9GAMM
MRREAAGRRGGRQHDPCGGGGSAGDHQLAAIHVDIVCVRALGHGLTPQLEKDRPRMGGTRDGDTVSLPWPSARRASGMAPLMRPGIGCFER